MISEVVVVVDQTPENNFETILASVTVVGLEIETSDADNGSIGGTIVSHRLPDLRTVTGVKYVRITMEYIADYPSGDPRDLDKDQG